MDETSRHINPNPVMKANFVSRLFYCWLNPIFRIGFKRSLNIEDVYNVLEEDSSHYLCSRLEKEWEKELHKVKAGKLPSLQRAMVRTFGISYSLWGLVILFEESIRVIQPLLLGRLITFFSSSSNMELWEGCLYAAGISVGALIPALTHHQYFLAMMKFGMWLRIATCSLVYKKCLRLSSGSLIKTTTGQIVNLMSNDVMRFDQSVLLLHFIIIGPLQGIIVCAILWHFVEWGTLAGFAILLLFFPVSMILSKIAIRLRSKTTVHTDERVRLMNEILNAMRIIKMYCWESVFEESVNNSRRKEVRRILKSSYARVASIVPFFFSGKLIVYFTFLTYILCGNKLTSEVVFVAIGLYNPLRLTMTFFFPVAIQMGSETIVTIRRLQEFLLLEEMDPASVPILPAGDSPPQVSVDKIESSWDMSAEHVIFKNLSFEVGDGELLAVIGPVGAGKTSLLMAMLGELPLIGGKIRISGKVAYVSQQPWVFSASVRQNITFGAEFNAEKYNRVIRASALTRDLAAMPEGDKTLIGDRGVSLSGGQKARLSLARALYYDADVYFLDDPLSAVDAKVSNHIFHKCICGILRKKPRILVTHQLQYLDATDKILILYGGENYRLGSFKELALDGINFVSLLRRFSSEGSASENVVEEPALHDTSDYDDSVMPLKAELHADLIPDIKFRGFSAQKWKLTHLSRSHGHLYSTNEDPAVGLLSSSLDGKHASAIAVADVNSKKKVHHAEFSDSHLFTQPIDPGGSLISVVSMLSIDDVAEFVPPVRVEEARAGGTVAFAIYRDYFLAGGGIFGFIVFAFLNIAAHVAFIICDWWLAYWCTSIENYEEGLRLLHLLNETVTSSSGVLADLHSNATSVIDKSYPYNTTYLLIFTGLTVSVVILAIIRSVHSFYLLVMSSVAFHDRMLSTILRCPIGFFDNNPIGRILNRFSKDLGQMDETLPYVLSDFVMCFLLVTGVFLLVGVLNPWVFIPTLPLAIVFLYLRFYFLRTTRNVKRMEATTKSPVFSHISTTVLGIQNIRAYCAQTIFTKEFDAHQDLHTSTFYLFLVLGRWFAVRLEIVTALFITSVCFCCVLASQSLDGSMVGLSLIYAISLMALFQWCVRQSSEVESLMTTVERIIEYSNLETEASALTHPNKRLPPGWPMHGGIVAEDVVLKYSPDGAAVLRGLNFEIYPSEKIGIVGRTGAGKSSLITILFRLVEPEGKLCIDGIDIKTIGLNDLRRNISIIPQDPVLLNGTIRRNLDPGGLHSDHEVWQALKQVQLTSMVEEMEGGLESKIQEGGANISMGQRQLICLSRAILKSNKILVIDEATANVDPRTDALIQQAIREQFSAFTVLTIAHRLNTIIDSDRIMVLDEGQIIEFDSPANLLHNSEGIFYQMAKQTGPAEFERLYEAAITSAENNVRKVQHVNGRIRPAAVMDNGI